MTERAYRICEASARAQVLGTYGVDDRSKQYPLDDSKKLVDAVNDCWTKIHRLERQAREKDVEIGQLKKQKGRWRFLANALISMFLILAWEGVKALAVYYLR
jgi:hypothetical protein